MSTVIYKLQDSGLSPTTQEKTLLGVEAKYQGDRDIKIFDMAAFAFLIEDVLSGFKIPNFMTDYGRQKESWTIQGEIVEDLHTPIAQTAWELRKFFMLTAFRYKNNYIEIDTYITKDNISVENSGDDPIYCRVKTFSFILRADRYESIPFTLVVYLGKIIRLMS